MDDTLGDGEKNFAKDEETAAKIFERPAAALFPPLPSPLGKYLGKTLTEYWF